jgi:hypothetical protein
VRLQGWRGPSTRGLIGPIGSHRAVPPCQTVLWARPSAHDTAHEPFTRVVPPMPPMGHGARVRARRAAVEGEGARRAARAAGRRQLLYPCLAARCRADPVEDGLAEGGGGR